MFTLRSAARAACGVAAAAALSAAGTAHAQVDLAITDVEITQSIRFFSTDLIANNVTYVRVLVDHPGLNEPVPDVDAIVRVFVDGAEADFSPLRSINGPITSPANPQDDEWDHHLNFWFISPDSTDVDVTVSLNPYGAVEETNFTNNTVTAFPPPNFECRDEVRVVYVPINYTPGGGLPNESTIEPGLGDGFLRAIFKADPWDYHRSPLGPLLWTQDINGSNNALLNELSDIRSFSLPSSGFPIPDIVYGWLPGNPFSGNGQANGIPGDAGFGNTQGSRYQRTFAHEFGHLFGEFHNGDDVGTIGFDVEHHLRDPLNLDIVQSPFKNDVMVAGQLTNSAFVSSSTLNQVMGDVRFQCSGDLDGLAGGPLQPVLRISGVASNEEAAVTLDPVYELVQGYPTIDRPSGLVDIVLYDAEDRPIYTVRAADRHVSESCASEDHEHPDMLPDAPLSVLVPAEVRGERVERIEAFHADTGVLLQSIVRSANVPQATFLGFRPADAPALQPAQAFKAGQSFTEPITVMWEASDPDGDSLQHALLYSPDGEAWLPFRTRIDGNSFTIDPQEMPRAAEGRLRLLTTDGLNTTEVDTIPMSFLGAGDPGVWLITPNNFAGYPRLSPIVFHAFAYDREDGVISDDVVWTSNVDGVFATGSLITYDGLSQGLHQIVVSVTDSDGNEVTDSIGVNITARPNPSPDLDGNGVVSFNDLLILLSGWGPCGDFCPADLDFSDEIGFNDLLILLSAWS